MASSTALSLSDFLCSTSSMLLQFKAPLNCTNIELVEHKKSDKDKAVEDALANQNNPMNDDDDLPF